MKKALILFFLVISTFTQINGQGGCPDVDADAGPDLFTCDPKMPVQLQGQTNAGEFEWVPTTYLSNPKILDPIVNAPVGKYKYTLKTKGLSNTNLIDNGDFESGFTGFSTAYTKSSPGGPFGPDNIDVGPNPQAYNGGFAPCGDHGGGGNQLIVDGSTSAGKNVWCQSVTTVSGRMYQLTFYVQSVYPVSPPNLNARVNGNSVGSVNAGGICEWVEFTTCFTATSGSSSICITEQSGVGFGNDFAIDDISLYEKCEDMDEVMVEVVDLKAVVKAPILPDCSSEPFELKANGSSTGTNVRYEWTASNGGKILSSNGLTATAKGSGTYKLKVIYQNGLVYCDKEVELDIDLPNDLLGEIFVDNEATCKFDTVFFLATISNGSGNFSYKWSPDSLIVGGQGSFIAKVLAPGKYSVTITDKSSGCEFEETFTVLGDTIGPNGNIIGDSLLTCAKNNVLLTGNPFDTAKNDLTWILPDNSTLQNQNTINSNQSGRYKLVITDKKNKCVDTSYFDVFENRNLPQFNLGQDLSIDCKNNGVTISSNPIGSGKYNYKWTLPNGNIITDTTLQNQQITQAGRVILHVTNTENGCDYSDTIDVTDLRQLPNANAGQDLTITCKNTLLTLQGTSNLSSNIRYEWKNNSGQTLNQNNSDRIQITQAGRYYFTVIDSNNFCERTDSIDIAIDQTKPNAQVEADKTFRCADTLVTLDGSLSDGGPRIKYQWLGNNIVNGANTKTATVNNVGTFLLVVIDTVNECSDTARITLTPDQNKPQVTASTIGVLDCVTKEVSLIGTAMSTSGGTLNYYWTSTNNSPITNPNSLNPKVQTPGTYTLWAIDQMNGCSTNIQTIVTIDTTAPIANAGLDQIWNCSSKTITLIAKDSTGNKYKFEWTTTNGKINSNSNQAQITITSPGQYLVKVIDTKNGCESTDEVSIVPDLNFPKVQFLPPADLTCKNVSVTISAQGSSSGINFIPFWNTIQGNITGPKDQISTTVDKAGVYYFTVFDTSNLCSNTDSIVVKQNITKPQADAGLDQSIGCRITQANIISNTNAQHEKSWSTTNGNIINGSNTDRITVDREGSYILTVTDPNNGCTATDEIIVTAIKNIPTQIQNQIFQPLCPEDLGGIEIENITGGTAPFEYYLNNKSITTTEIDDLTPGNYILKVIDKNGCEFEKTIVINAAIGVDVDLVPQVELYAGDEYKIIPKYSIPDDSIAWVKWEPAENLSCANCLYPIHTANTDQSYTVTFANKNGCIATSEIKIKINSRNVWFPNVITSNGDNINDRFFPKASSNSFRQVNFLSIYDRWGEKIFHQENFPANDPTQGWEGKFNNEYCIPGVYVYVVEIEWNNGDVQKFFGDVTLIR